jgi:phosphatidylinositol glycan class O
MDKLPVLQRLARENRNSARIFKFVADPPTTTLQRLKVGVCTNPKCECNLVI